MKPFSIQPRVPPLFLRIVAYALLGSTWLLVKTEGALETKMRDYSRPLACLLMAMVVSSVLGH